jgi:HK97 family phage prohead protease
MADDVLRRTAPPDLSTRIDGRTVHGIIVPFDQETRVNDGWGPYTEVIKRGAFAKTIAQRESPCKLCINHDKTVRLPVGVATKLREESGGVYGEFRIARTQEGNDALELIRDGVVDSFSVGMIPIKEHEKRRGYVERTEVKLTETSLVSFPAYVGARIAGIRSAYGMEEGEWDRLRDLLRSHPGLLEDLTRDLIIDTPELGAVIHDLDTEVVSEPAEEATRSDVPLQEEHTADPQHVPAARPGPMTAERRRELRDRVRALL